MNQKEKASLTNTVGMVIIAVIIFINICVAIHMVPKQQECGELTQIEETLVPLNGEVECEDIQTKFELDFQGEGMTDQEFDEFMNHSGKYFAIMGIVGIGMFIAGIILYQKSRTTES